MTLNEYQKAAMTTCMATCDNVPYMLFNLQGEVGELSSKIAKAIRKGDLEFCHDSINDIELTNVDAWHNSIEKKIEFKNALIGELGDVLWQLSGLCSVLGFDLENVAQCNLDKLASRQQRGVIDGNGDNR